MENQKSSKKKYILYFGLFVAVLVLNVYLAILSASRGSELLAIENQTEKIVVENRDLSAQVVYETSLKDLSEKAQELGMVKPEEIIYLSGAAPVAKLP